jgi:hypothetical protein
MKKLTKFEKLPPIKIIICAISLGGFRISIEIQDYMLMGFFVAILALTIYSLIIKSKKGDKAKGKIGIVKEIINDHQFKDQFGEIHDFDPNLRITGYTDQKILDEMDTDMEDSGVAQGEIVSNLGHWTNKYLIFRRKNDQK